MTWNAKQHLLWLAAIFALLLSYLGAFYPDRLTQLHTHWTTAGDLDMGYILLALTAYFSYKNFDPHKVRPNFVLLPGIIILTAGFVLSESLDIKSLFFLCLALSLPFFCAIVLGFGTTLSILSAWAIVVMALPFWYLAIPILQGITVKVVSFWASLLSLTVLVEGNYFTVTSGVVHVAGGCSGLKYFMTALSLALISSAFNKRRISRSLLSLIVAAALAMIGNWIRVFILLLVAYYEGVGHPLMEDHDALGWVVFSVVMLPWFLADRYLDTPKEHNTSRAKQQSVSTKQLSISFIACSALLITCHALLSPPERPDNQTSTPDLPDNLSNFRLIKNLEPHWKPNFPLPENSISGRYLAQEHRLDISIYTYLNNGPSEMANSENTIFDDREWLLISDQAWQDSNPKAQKMRIALAKSGKEHREVYYWYQHGGIMANSIGTSKFEQLKSSYRGIHDSQLIAVSKLCNLACQRDLTPPEDILKLALAIK